MRVGHLALEDFRNYREAAVDLDGGLNLIVGRNAQGKTNLLEAVYRLSGLHSPRGADALLVREGAEQAFLRAEVTRGSRTVHVDMELRPGRSARALVNKKAGTSSRVLGELAVPVFFGPDELSLIKGSPDGRRRFLDDLIVKLHPARIGIRREFDKTLKQRNALLRARVRGQDVDRASLEVWDESFCAAAAALAAERLAALIALTPHAHERYGEIAGGGALGLTYVSSWCPPEVVDAAVGEGGTVDRQELQRALRKRMAEVHVGELERGLTLVGPQRDDVDVLLDSPGSTLGFMEARSFASQGDQRTCALALKIGEHDLLRSSMDDPPILLLDDVFSELDPQRRAWLRKAVRDAGQTLLSSADTTSVDDLDAEATFEVTAGTIVARR